MEAELIHGGRLLAAAILGGLLGLEREAADKPAGLRTHLLVALAAALIVITGDLARVGLPPEAAGDPARALHAVITGIGFLGAGTILTNRDKAQVHGLTTATSLFLAAGIGVAAGIGEILLAAGAAVLGLFTLRGLAYVEARMGTDGDDKKADP